MDADFSRKFSPSKLGAYQDCPRRYRYRYVDKIKREEESVEAYVGTCAHRALEELYDGLQHGKVMTEEELVSFFDAQWDKGWSNAILIRDQRYSREDWKKVGQDALRLYHRSQAPFDQARTVGLEKRLGFSLETKIGRCRIEGFIDRLALAPDGAFEIHDYKTGKALPTQEELDADWQLAIYDAAVREAWPQTKTVRLVWHYLRYGQSLRSQRSPEALEDLKVDIARLIEAIAADREFTPKESPLCGWCEYRDICPLWAHAEKIAALPEPLRGQDAGARLVDELAGLEERKKSLKEKIGALEDEEAALKESIARFAKEQGVSAVFGTRVQASISEKTEYKFPTKTHAPEAFAALEKELQSGPFWMQASHFDAHRFLESRKNRAWSLEQLTLLDDIIARYATPVHEHTVRLKRRKESAED